MSWELDATHSQVVFAVKHMVVSTVRGNFNVVRGAIEFDGVNPLTASIEAEADAASINTRDANRDGHLRSADFFDVEKYPLITFKSTNVEQAGEDYKVTGDLTMHGVTKTVTFDAEFGGIVKDPWGMTRMGVNGHTKISRKNWGLVYNGVLEAGGAVLGDEVKIEFELEAVQK